MSSPTTPRPKRVPAMPPAYPCRSAKGYQHPEHRYDLAGVCVFCAKSKADSTLASSGPESPGPKKSWLGK